MKLIPALITLAICYAILFYYVSTTQDSLPPRIATHFDLYGQPNGWMSRDQLTTFILGFGILLPAFVVAVMAATGWIPVSFVNLPHRDYWLAPERRQATASRLLHFGLWFASANVLFITGLQWLIVQANLPGAGQHLSGLGLALVAGGFLLATGIWCTLLIRQFKVKA
jgi:uncharacterized membrane protein